MFFQPFLRCRKGGAIIESSIVTIIAIVAPLGVTTLSTTMVGMVFAILKADKQKTIIVFLIGDNN